LTGSDLSSPLGRVRCTPAAHPSPSGPLVARTPAHGDDLDPVVKASITRSGIVLAVVGAGSSVCVYLGHGWFHGVFLPFLGVSAPLGDAVGGLLIVLMAFLAQILVSTLLFKDGFLGLLRSHLTLRHAEEGLRAEIEELDQLASTDRLTGAWNRRWLENLAAAEIDRLARSECALSMLMLDIDHFKAINDVHGHAVGDDVLAALADTLRRALRPSDSLIRWGGEEFVVLSPGTTLTAAIVLAERLRGLVASAGFAPVGHLTISLGAAECLPGESWRQWLERADASLYRAKAGGRNQVRFAPEAPVHPHDELVLGGGLVQLHWHPSHCCGHQGIDRAHQSLFSISNDLLAAMLADARTADVAEIVALLVREVAAHFDEEEAVLAAAGYPDLAEHKALHHTLLERAKRLAQEFAAGTLEIGPLFQFLSYDVVARHMLGADRKYFPWILAASAADADQAG